MPVRRGGDLLGHNALTAVTTGGGCGCGGPILLRPLPRRALSGGRAPGAGSGTTPGAQARLAVLSALAPFVQAPDLLAQLGLPLHLDIKSTGQVAQAVGKQLATTLQRPTRRRSGPSPWGSME